MKSHPNKIEPKNSEKHTKEVDLKVDSDTQLLPDDQSPKTMHISVQNMQYYISILIFSLIIFASFGILFLFLKI